MEDLPAQESRPPASAEVPRSRAPRRRAAPKAVPPVMFQPPPAAPETDTTGANTAGNRAGTTAEKKAGTTASSTAGKRAGTMAGTAAANRAGTAVDGDNAAAGAQPTAAVPRPARPARKRAPRAKSTGTPTAAPSAVEPKTAKPSAVKPRTVKPRAAETETAKTETAEIETAEIETAETRTVVRQTVAPRTDWAQLLGAPQHLPERLALAAVQTIGPRAQRWADRVRGTYPAATPRAVAGLAAAQFTRRGGVGAALAAAAGPYAPVALLGAATWTHAELVLHVAAAHGHDPTAPARAAELLWLTRTHPTRADAEAAVAAAQPQTDPAPVTDSARSAGLGELRLGRAVVPQLGGWLAARVVNRALPGAGLLAATLSGRSAAETVAVRALAFYRAG